MIPSPEAARGILTRLAEIGIFAAVIWAAILLFRAAFRDKASPALRFGLWFLLLLRLTVPVTVASTFHLIVLPPAAPQPAPAVTEVQAAGTRPASSPKVTLLPAASEEPRITAAPREGTPAVRPAARSLSVWQILLIAWLGGAAVFLGNRLRMLGMLGARLRSGAKEPDPRTVREFKRLCAQMRVRRRVRLLEVEDITSPALTVGLRPTVLMPSSLAGAERKAERRFALRHELTHLKRGDPLVMLWYGALRCVWWFHPVVWLMEKSFRMDMESACDAKAVVGMSREDKLFYASLLLDLGKDRSLQARPGAGAEPGLTGPRRSKDER